MTDSRRPLRARYIGYTRGTENHGDEALIWIVRDVFSPEIEVDPAADSYDIALLGGGTLINQSPWLIDAFRDALNKAGHGIVVGTGVGDPSFWGHHFTEWVPLLNQCDFVGVRGPESLRLLRENGCDRAQCVGDPYLLLRGSLSREPAKQMLGINVGRTNDSLLGGGRDADLHDYLVEVLTRLRGRGWSFFWVSVWSKDLPVVNDVRQRLGPPFGPVYDARVHSLETLSALSQCEVFLGEKLHACAMAAVAGVPFVALEYQPKVRDFAASLDMLAWTVSTEERDAGGLVGRVEELRGRRGEIVETMAKRRDELCDRFRRFVREIKSFYRGGHRS